MQGLLGGEKERTEARLRAALDGLQMAVGNDDASTANAMTNLALFLKGCGQHAEAVELYTAVLATRCVRCEVMAGWRMPRGGLARLGPGGVVGIRSFFLVSGKLDIPDKGASR